MTSHSILHLEPNHIFYHDLLKCPTGLTPAYLSNHIYHMLQLFSHSQDTVSVTVTSMVLCHLRFTLPGTLYFLFNRLAPSHLLELSISGLKWVSQV